MLQILNYDTIFFDCDGVILDSNQVKTDAFAISLKDYPKALISKFLEYHKSNGGVSRYEKFEHFFTNINPVNEKDKNIELSLERYSSITRESLLSCNLIPGVIETLEIISEKSKNIFVITGGDQEEVRYVFKERSLNHFFTDILGSPKTKDENMNKVLNDYKKLGKCLFFGDSRVDFEVANSFQCDFVFVSKKSEWHDGESFMRDNGYISISNFDDLI